MGPCKQVAVNEPFGFDTLRTAAALNRHYQLILSNYRGVKSKTPWYENLLDSHIMVFLISRTKQKAKNLA